MFPKKFLQGKKKILLSFYITNKRNNIGMNFLKNYINEFIIKKGKL